MAKVKLYVTDIEEVDELIEECEDIEVAVLVFPDKQTLDDFRICQFSNLGAKELKEAMDGPMYADEYQGVPIEVQG